MKYQVIFILKSKKTDLFEMSHATVWKYALKVHVPYFVICHICIQMDYINYTC